MQNGDEFIVRSVRIAFEVVFRNAHQLRSEVELVEAVRVFAYCCIAPPPDVRQNIGDRFFNVLFHVAGGKEYIDFG
jgi:hypothetical protein